MDGKDFLDVSKRLCESDFEADRRTSVSRAYYAFFNHIKTLLKAKVSLPDSAEAHEKMRQYLNNSGMEEAKDIANNLSALRTKRNEADYTMSSTDFNKNNCVLSYKRAVICIQKFDEIDHKSLIAGIKEYLAKMHS
jgi:uncharacterized protein (UPF0332 family)